MEIEDGAGLPYMQECFIQLNFINFFFVLLYRSSNTPKVLSYNIIL